MRTARIGSPYGGGTTGRTGVSNQTGKNGGQLDGFNQAVRIGSIFSGNIEGRAVIGRGPDKGKTQAHVDSAVKGQEFKGNESLVMIKGDDDCIRPPDGTPEDDVGGVGAAARDALPAPFLT